MSKTITLVVLLASALFLPAFDCRDRDVAAQPYGEDVMAFTQRTAVPLDPAASPLLPQADSAQAHDIPTGVNPTTAKLQDWVFFLAGNPALVETQQYFANGVGVGTNVDTFSSASFTAASAVLKTIEDVHTNDLVLARASLILSGNYGGTLVAPTQLRLYMHRGALPIDVLTDVVMNGGRVWLCANADFVDVTIEGMRTAEADEDVTVYVAAAVPSGSLTIHNASLVVHQIRIPTLP